jgi:polyhydroxybutyrate depolymerase
MILIPVVFLLAMGAFLVIPWMLQVQAGKTNSVAMAPHTQRHVLLHMGKPRTYTVYTPASVRPDDPAPVILAFHGFRGNGLRMMYFTRLNTLADREGVIVVYPDAILDRWHTRSGTYDVTPEDVTFVQAMIVDLKKTHTIDNRRIYATGISNGGFFTQRLACELSDEIAAFAPVAATMGKPLKESCHPTRPIPILMFHGLDDPVVTWDGQIKKVRDSFSDAVILSVPETDLFWRNQNGCAPEPTATILPDVNPNDGTRVRRIVYASCQDDAEVIQVVIDRGGHTWPGGESGGLPVQAVLGKTSEDIEANREMWAFFQKHPLPQP